MVSHKSFRQNSSLQKKTTRICDQTKTRNWSTSLKNRFWSKVLKTSYCWEWKAGKTGNNYGSIKVNRKQIGVHRVSYMLSGRKIPFGFYVLHHCDNKSCVRPSHLYIGTNQDNMNDAKKRGQIRSLDKHPRTHLLSKDIEEIRKLSNQSEATYNELANKFKVSKSCISAIVNKQNWKHV